MVSLKTALRPVLGFGRVFGLFPYGETGRTRKFLRLYSIAAILLLTAARAWCLSDVVDRAIVHTREESEYGSEFIMYWVDEMLDLKRLLSLPTLLSLVYFIAFRPDKMERVHARLKSIDGFLGSKGYSSWSTGACMMFHVAILSTYRLDYFWIYVPFKEFILENVWKFMGDPIIIVVVVSQFSVLQEAAVCQFRKLNRLTEESSELEKCVEMHSELCNLVAELREIYTLPLLTMTLLCFISIFEVIGVVFHFGRNLNAYCDPGIALGQMSPDSHFGLLLSELALGWSLSLPTVAYLTVICFFGYEVSYESDAFSDSLCRAMRSWHYPCHNRKLLAYVAVRPSVDVHVWNLFRVDNSLLRMCWAVGLSLFLCYVSWYKNDWAGDGGCTDSDHAFPDIFADVED